MISDLDNYHFDYSDFSDSARHLNLEAAIRRSEILANEINEYLAKANGL